MSEVSDSEERYLKWSQVEAPVYYIRDTGRKSRDSSERMNNNGEQYTAADVVDELKGRVNFLQDEAAGSMAARRTSRHNFPAT